MQPKTTLVKYPRTGVPFRSSSSIARHIVTDGAHTDFEEKAGEGRSERGRLAFVPNTHWLMPEQIPASL